MAEEERGDQFGVQEAESADEAPQAAPPAEDADTAIRAIVVRLARRTADGGHSVERAAMLAEGSDMEAIEAWILRHGGEPQTAPQKAGGGGRGLFAERDSAMRARARVPPQRYILPSAAL